MMTPQLWPIFICYRLADGLTTARRLHEILDKWNTAEPDGKLIQIDVYFDESMPGVENWNELHRPYLEKARAIIVVCTPGTKLYGSVIPHQHSNCSLYTNIFFIEFLAVICDAYTKDADRNVQIRDHEAILLA
jgi:hypothetical protein